MKRRELLSLLGVSSLPGFLLAQSGAPDAPLAVSSAEAVAESAQKFFSGPELATFRHLGDLLVPAGETEPGALTARAPEFLDFLLSQSPAAVQTLYRNGVRELDRRAKKPFTKVTESEAATVLSPLTAAWSYTEPADPFAQFLLASKVAFWQATTNSREWAEARSGSRRSAAGTGTYWLQAE